MTSLFYPFRALGYVNEGVPFVEHRRGTEHFVTVSAGKAFQVYNCERLRLVLVGPQGDADITALAVKGDLTFAAHGRDIVVCRRTHRVCVFGGHADTVTRLFTFGPRLYSICAGGRVLGWDIGKDALDHLDGKRSSAAKRAADIVAASMADDGDGSSDSDSGASDSDALDDETAFDDDQDLPRRDPDTGAHLPREYRMPEGFTPTCICHPDTYLNKVLIGATDGRVLLLNVNTGKHIYVFHPNNMLNPSGSAVTCLEQSPALDTVAVGLGNGRVVIQNVRVDRTVVDFTHDGSGRAIRSMSFTTGNQDPLIAVGSDAGSVSVWDLEKRRLRTIMPGTHDGAVTQAHFFLGQPVLMTGGADNALKQWIFDNADGTGRLLRFRAGHSAPPTHVEFYGEGLRILSAGDDRALRVFSTIQDQQSKELSQSHVERRAKKLGVAEQELKLPPIRGMAWCEVRERDWANVVTCHAGETRAYTWRLANGVLGEHVLQPPAKMGVKRRNLGISNKVGFPISAVAVSACGNFAVIGNEGGEVHRFNLQSGQHRGVFKRLGPPRDAGEGRDEEAVLNGIPEHERIRRQLNLRGGKNSIWNMADKSYGMDAIEAAKKAPKLPAHSGQVSAIQTDGANKQTVTCGFVDGVVRVWNFGEQKLEGEMDTGVGCVAASLHRPGALVAVAGADRVVRVLDIAGMRRVRSLRGAQTQVKSLQFSADGRLILANSADGAVHVWDVPAARLLQTMRMSRDSPVVGLSLSPNMDMLATVHEGRRGVYLWANSQMYSAPGARLAGASTRVAGSDDSDSEEAFTTEEEAQETPVELPRLHAELGDAGEIILGATEEEEADPNVNLAVKAAKEAIEDAKKEAGPKGAGSDAQRRRAPEPVAPGLATMAMLPKTQWASLARLDEIRERNKPIQGPKKPKEAPFFIPTTYNADDPSKAAVFDVDAVIDDSDDEDGAKDQKSRILTGAGDDGGDVEGVFVRLVRVGAKKAEAIEEIKAAEGKNKTKAKAAEAKRKLAALRRKRRRKNGGEGGGGADEDEDEEDEETDELNPRGGPYAELIAHLRRRGPSGLDAEIRALGPWDASTMTDDDAAELGDVLDFFAAEIPSGRNFEFLNALLAHFLRVHGGALQARESLRLKAEKVRAAAKATWKGVDDLLQEVRCALGFFGGVAGV